jgi:hypothetical protein
VPSILFSIFVFPMRRRPLVAFCIVGIVTCYLLGWLSIPLRSFGLHRIGLGGIWFAQLAVAAWAADRQILNPRNWMARIRALFTDDLATACLPAVEILLVVMLFWAFATQTWSILRQPYLARAYVARLAGRGNKQLDLRSRYQKLLAAIQPHDVVLSDRFTAWPIPSFGGRIVAAAHREFFIDDEPRRYQDVTTFFASDSSDAKRLEILERNKVRWILLNRDKVSEKVFDNLLEHSAVVTNDDELTLMDAKKWAAQHQKSESPAPAKNRKKAA